jgi:thiosulfate/3-mercaptopyruvate sulfurtransferase
MSALVDAATLADELERGETLVVDVQYALGGPPSRELYAVAHLPGAPQLSLDAALAGPSGDGGRHPLPDPAVLRSIAECGIDDDSRVVVYDQGTSLSASRALV